MNEFEEIKTELQVKEAPAKNKKAMALIIGAAVLLILGVAAFIVLRVPEVKNSLALTFMQPEEYYENLERENAAEAARIFGGNYEIISQAINGAGGEAVSEAAGGNISVSLSEAFAVEELGLDKGYSLDIPYFYQMSEGLSYAEIGANINGAEIVTLDVLSDMNTADIYVRPANVTDAYIKISEDYLTRLMEDSYYYDPEAAVDAAEITNKLFDGQKLSEGQLNLIFDRYLNIWFSEITQNGYLEMTENIPLTTGVIDDEYTEIKITLSEKQAADLILKMAAEMKDDAQIIELLEIFGVQRTDLLDAIAEFENLATDYGNGEIEFYTYVDSKGVIAGRKIVAAEDNETLLSMSFNIAEDADGGVAAEVSLESDGDSIYVEINGVKSSSGAFTGTGRAVYSQEWDGSETEVLVNFNDLNVSGEILTGDMSFTVSGHENYVFGIKFRQEGAAEVVTFEFIDMGAVVFSVEVSEEALPVRSLSLPSDNVFELSEETDWGAYLQTYDLSGLRAAAHSVLGDMTIDGVSLAPEDIDGLFDMLEVMISGYNSESSVGVIG